MSLPDTLVRNISNAGTSCVARLRKDPSYFTALAGPESRGKYVDRTDSLSGKLEAMVHRKGDWRTHFRRIRTGTPE